MAAAEPKAEEDQFAELRLPDGRTHKIKIITPTVGNDRFLDVRDLYAKTGHFTYDPGFTCTASCSSAITFIDGDAGVCLYRGYAVADLCKSTDFMDTCHLLLEGELPGPEDKTAFVKDINSHMMLHEKFKDFFKGFQAGAHPMAIMITACGALSAFHKDSIDIGCPESRKVAAEKIVAKLPTIAASSYKTAIGQPIIYPCSSLSYSENFLRMMFATPMGEYKVNPIHAKAIDKFLILHADHEQNASTSTVRIAGSSQANPFACIAAGVASLWGPAHGGANEAVIQMLESIGSVENVAQFVLDVKNKKAGVRLMGFGHRVYKNYDPRAKYMKGLVGEVLNSLGVVDPHLALAMELERVALSDEYFIKRKLYPNVDFYSGIMLRAIGIPVPMFTVLFAIARGIGWITQWQEMISEKQLRICRPRQIYVGTPLREVAKAEEAVPEGRRLSVRRGSSKGDMSSHFLKRVDGPSTNQLHSFQTGATLSVSNFGGVTRTGSSQSPVP